MGQIGGQKKGQGDGDGKDREKLKRELYKYYEERNLEDVDRLPRVTEKNVLILKYYSLPQNP